MLPRQAHGGEFANFIVITYFAQCLPAQLILVCMTQVRPFSAWDFNPAEKFLSEITPTAQSASYASANFVPTNIEVHLKKINRYNFNEVTIPRQERLLCFWKRQLLEKKQSLMGNCELRDLHSSWYPFFHKAFVLSIMVISRSNKT